MGNQDFEYLINLLKKMDEKQLSEGIKIINSFLSDEDKKKLNQIINKKN